MFRNVRQALGRHNSRCKARVDAFVKAEKAAKIGKAPSIPPAEGSKPLEELLIRTIYNDVAPECPAPTDTEEVEVNPDDLPFGVGIPPGAAVGKAFANR